MRWVKAVIVVLLVLSLGSLLHYTLPRQEVVRIVGVETRLETFGFNRFFFASAPPGMGASATRDVRYIESLRPDRRERVFRNEDTGWGWPPFFKMNSADMQARARDLVSTAEEPRWVRLRYYGIRSQLFSIYPNVLSVTQVQDPDDVGLPWVRITAFAALAGLALWVWLRLRRFRQERLDPLVAEVVGRKRAARGRVAAFFDRLHERLFGRK